MAGTQKIATHLWFNGNAEEAVEFYTSFSRFAGHERRAVGRRRPRSTGRRPQHRLRDGGPEIHRAERRTAFTFTPAISLSVSCESQAEVDELWTKLLAGGGKPKCGWLDDRYGLSWQVVPSALIELMSDPDPKASGRVAQALMGMQKIDIASLLRAHLAA